MEYVHPESQVGANQIRCAPCQSSFWSWCFDRASTSLAFNPQDSRPRKRMVESTDLRKESWDINGTLINFHLDIFSGES